MVRILLANEERWKEGGIYIYRYGEDEDEDEDEISGGKWSSWKCKHLILEKLKHAGLGVVDILIRRDGGENKKQCAECRDDDDDCDLHGLVFQLEERVLLESLRVSSGS